MKKFDATKVDIEKMSKKTGVPIVTIKSSLNLPLSNECTATTCQEAEEAYYATPDGSEAQAQALKK